MAKKIRPITTDVPNRRIWRIFAVITWLICGTMKLLNRGKVKKTTKLPKPPYLLLCTHASMMDFYMLVSALKPRMPYWVSTVEEFIDKDFLFRRLGVVAKRKFSNDPKNAMLMMDVLKNRKKIFIIFPEARYSFVGIDERIDNSLGRFAKMANVPIVYAQGHGDYLYDPQWGDHKTRKVHPITLEIGTLVDRYDIETMSAEEIQQKLYDTFSNNEEEWQRKNNIKITYKNRAVGLHRILYKCPHCGTEFEMTSSGHTLKCNHCGIEYDYLEDGHLKCLNGETKFDYPSKWYRWEKEEVKKEVESGKYHFEDEVRVEKLVGVGVGFVPQEGKYTLTHSIENGFEIKGVDNDFEYHRSSLQSFAVHVEYNYHGRGACLDLATSKDTWFVYPLNKPLYLTKIHFAVECIYDHLKANLKTGK